MVLKLRDQILAGPAGAERPLMKDELITLARGVDLDALELGEHRRFESHCYARNIVFINEHIELVVICWGAGQASAVHDHGKSTCLYLVKDGTLGEEIFELDAAGELKLVDDRSWSRGEITVAVGPTIHRISNPGEDKLVTVHFYSPPLGDTVTNYTPIPTYPC